MVTDKAQTHHGSNGSGLPPWMRFVWLIGVPSAIALFLVWRLDGRQSQHLMQIESRLEAHALVTLGAAGTLTKASEDGRAETRTLITLMRQVCVNTARTDEQRRECVR